MTVKLPKQTNFHPFMDKKKTKKKKRLSSIIARPLDDINTHAVCTPAARWRHCAHSTHIIR